MEASAKAVIGGDFDYTIAGSSDSSEVQHGRLIRTEHSAALKGPNRKAILAERRRLSTALRRRGQPRKYPEVDAAILAAVSSGEPRDAVIRWAIAAVRQTDPSVTYSRVLHRKFLDRLKKAKRLRRKLAE